MVKNLENQYLDAFHSKARHEALSYEVHDLYYQEWKAHAADRALTLLAIFPDLGYVDKINKIHKQMNEAEILRLREHVSEKILKIVAQIEPKEFKSFNDARQFEEMLLLIDGSMMTATAKENFNRLRERARSKWQGAAFAEGKAERQALMNELQAHERTQAAYWESFKVTMANQQASLSQIKQQVKVASEQQSSEHVVIRADIQQMGSALTQYFKVELDHNTLVLLQADKVLSQQVNIAINYLKRQEQREIEAMHKAHQQMQIDGVLRGFAFLQAVGEVTNNKSLQVLAVVGSEGFKIGVAITQLSQLSGLAALNPYAAIGLSALNIASLLMSTGPTTDEIMLRQLAHISKQIQQLHLAMDSRFERVEALLVVNFQYIHYMLAGPTTRKLDDIQAQLQTISDTMNLGFKALITTDLENIVSIAAGLSEAEIDKSVYPIGQVYTWLKTLNEWLMTNAFKVQLTHVNLVTESPKALATMLSKIDDKTNAVPLLYALAHQAGVLDTTLPKLPHFDVWVTAVTAYIQLRRVYQEELHAAKFDKAFKQLQAIVDSAEMYYDLFSELARDSGMLNYAANALLAHMDAMLNHYTALKQKVYSSVLPGAILPPSTPILNKDVKVLTMGHRQTTEMLPVTLTSSQRLTDKVAEMAKFPVSFNLQTVLKQASNLAKSQGVELFPHSLLWAEENGLLSFSFDLMHCHPVKAPNGNTIYSTGYGLMINVHIAGVNFPISSAENGLITQPDNSIAQGKQGQYTVALRLNASKPNNVNSNGARIYLRVSPSKIQEAVIKLQSILGQRLQPALTQFEVTFSESLLSSQSILYRTRCVGLLLNVLLENSHYTHQYFSLVQVEKLLHAIEQQCLSVGKIDYAQLDEYYSQLKGIATALRENSCIPLPIDTALNFADMPNTRLLGELSQVRQALTSLLMQLSQSPQLANTGQLTHDATLFGQSRHTLLAPSAEVQLNRQQGNALATTLPSNATSVDLCRMM